MSDLQNNAKALLPVIQAAADGKDVEVRFKGSKKDLWELRTNSGARWDLSNFEYRIKPEPKLRPYTREEWERVDKVRDKDTGVVSSVLSVTDCTVYVYGLYGFGFHDAMERFEHLDGSPCGVMEK